MVLFVFVNDPILIIGLIHVSVKVDFKIDCCYQEGGDMKLKIQNDIKEVMRSKDELKLSVLRMLSAAIHNKELEKRAKTGKSEELTDEETIGVIHSEAKKRRDAIAEFEKGGRKDLADKESAELKILEGYLPQELSDEEIEKIVREVVVETGISDPTMFGRIMGEVMKRVKGRASGERMSAAVKKLLTPDLTRS